MKLFAGSLNLCVREKLFYSGEESPSTSSDGFALAHSSPGILKDAVQEAFLLFVISIKFCYVQ